MEYFKDRLKELRNEKGLSKRKLAEYINVDHASISRWENDIQDHCNPYNSAF